MSCCCAPSLQSVLDGMDGCGKGKVAIVTGANTGIGKTTAKALASVGFNVIIAGRNMAAMENAKKSIEQTLGLKGVGGGGITLLKTALDIGSVASIKEFVHEFLEQKLALHVLVNNAGVSNAPTTKTKEGLEYTIGVNWFGGFLLTHLLLDTLKQSAPSRVIIVSSNLHNMGSIQVDSIDRILYPSSALNLAQQVQAYNNSKLANVLHAMALTKRVDGMGVSVYSLHPGVVRTDLVRNLNCCLWCIMRVNCCLKNVDDGSATTVYCAIANIDASANGHYFADARLKQASNRALKDDKVSEALWAKGEELVKKFSSPS